MPQEAAQILLVEEDRTLADITAFRLELLGYTVKCVHSAEEALVALDQELPEVIILDLYLPGMDGLELTNRLSNDHRTCSIPVMAFSSDSDLGKVHRAYAAGVKDFLLTPYDPAVLERKLEKLLVAAG